MAQRTGAERFLASSAKSASAGTILALALAALALAGCGGGSADPESGSSTTALAATSHAAGAADPPVSQVTGKTESSSPHAAGSDPAEGQGANPTRQGGDGQKHGRGIAQPKGVREQAPTPAEIANATVADMSLTSPAILASGGNPGSLSPVYTCDGKNSWPALSWRGVPAGTAELALFVMNVQPVEEQLFVDWAIAGIDPGLSEIEAGELPPGGVVGRNSFGSQGYSICPAGQGEIYMFALYALPNRLGLRPGFDGREARAQVLESSGNVGLLPALYAHG